ncbi:uncharacterized protein LOC131929564 [Physella acuta]|uniref:uncharacterized protein LOC131929564 n=1 Tax=Physella acuta TaxID=109671 RepID=UPI0027DCC482|nr:uncharacterized protein LOC131929564 [Physella acuta]XP_059141815.1 uncharacterized protein LOC131929564 [Physella acuta]
MSIDAEDNGILVDFDITKVVLHGGEIKHMLEKQFAEHGTKALKHPDVDRSTSSSLPPTSEAETLYDEHELVSRLADAASSGASAVSGLLHDVMSSTVFTEGSQTVNSTEDSVYIQPSDSDSWSAADVGAVTLVSLMVPFILCSNLLVFVSVVRYRRLHTPTNYFITSLAAVDILVSLAVPFFVVVEVFHFGGASGPQDVLLCLLPNRVLMMACGVSVLTLATIAYDRHTALVSPLEYINIMTTRKVMTLVTLTWVYSAFIVWLPLMVGWYDVPTELAPCSSDLLKGKASLLFLVAIFLPSCVAILVCYFRIFMVARHHAKAIAAMELAVHGRLQVKFMLKDTKYAKTLALVIGVFLALWFPYLIYIFALTISAIKFNIWLQTYLILLAVLNSGINPWIYAFKNNEFRAAFRRMLKECCSDRFCKPADRRPSLVSAISSTPRLSRTDSRMVSTLLETTLEVLNEKLKRGVNSPEDSGVEGSIKSSSEPRFAQVNKKLRRQTASCCNLDSVKELTPTKPSRRFSLDFSQSTRTLRDIANHACAFGSKSPAYVLVETSEQSPIVKSRLIKSFSSGVQKQTYPGYLTPHITPSSYLTHVYPQLLATGAHIRHSEHSSPAFCYTNEALELDSTESSAAFHPQIDNIRPFPHLGVPGSDPCSDQLISSHPAVLLCHTQSCPTFDLARLHSLLDSHCTHLGESSTDTARCKDVDSAKCHDSVKFVDSCGGAHDNFFL